MVVDHRDRGQLILVSAIALAFIILGFVVVLNGVLYTQAVSSGNTLEDATDADGSAVEVRRGVAGVTRSVNRGQYDNDVNLQNAVEADASAFASRYTNVTSDSRASIADLETTNASDWEYGRLVSQPDPGEFTNGSHENWNVYNSTNADARGLEQFVLTLNATDTGDGFTVLLDNESDDQRTITFEEGDGDTLDVTVDGTTCRLDSRADDTVELDLLTGAINGHDGPDACDTRITAGLEGDYDQLRFENGDDAVGRYEIVFNGSSATDFETDSSLAALTVEVDYRYQSDAVSLERRLEVDVYGGKR